MYLHAGNDFVINDKEIIGIFDMDNTTVSRQGRNFLSAAQSKNIIKNAATDGLPRSYVVANGKDGDKVFLSSLSSKVLAKILKSKSMAGNFSEDF